MEQDRQLRALKILEGIMPKLYSLLGKHDLMKFHAECSSLYTRIETALEIMICLNAGPPSPLHASEIYIENLVKYLTKIRYIPENIIHDEFLVKFRDRIDYVYELYQWLLVNEDKVKLRAYLTKYVDPVNIPEEFLHDPDIRKVYMGNSELIELFWSEYKKFMAAEKGIQETKELQSDLKAMFQEAANIEKRTKSQKQKLQTIANSETLTMFAKAYYEANRQQGKISNEISATTVAIRNLEHLIKELDEDEKKYSTVNDGNFLASIQEMLSRNKTMLHNSLQPEKHQGMQMCHILEETIRQSAGTEQLVAKASTLKTDIQELLTEKMSLHSSTEDKLSPFRKQAAGVSNKKKTLSEKVRNQRNYHEVVASVLKTKEAEIHEAVGGEVYHGDQLKSYIGQLRSKSNQYKSFRSHLQAYATEAVTLNRTIDILRLIDPSVDDLIAQPLDEETESQKESNKIHTDSVQEAKHLCKSLTQEIDASLVTTSHVHAELAEVKKEIENLGIKHEQSKERYDQTIKFVSMDVESLKEDLQVKQDRIEILEQQWKDTTQELDKLDQVFSRLVDDLLEDNDAENKKDTYYDQLLEKKLMIEKAIDSFNSQVIDNEEKQEQMQRRVKFYKDIEVLITKKLGSL